MESGKQGDSDEVSVAGLLSRRAVLKRSLAGLAVMGARSLRAGPQAESKPPAREGEDAEIAQVEKKAHEAGLGPLRPVRTEHFLSFGDAPASFQRDALSRCEELGGAFLDHFRRRGFTAEYPPRRLTIITLKDEASYAALLGEAPGKDVGGHYDLETNRLVVFDFRPRQEGLAIPAERVNLFTLVHETAHQLSFNTGMLDRQGALPLCILEGLATYVEMWRPGVKNSIGGINRPRLQAMRDAADWIPIADLLANDRAFAPETEQLAYAESWLLLHYFLRASTRQPKLRDYLTQAERTKKPADRAGIAEKALGPLARLDKELKDEGRRYLRG